MSDKESENSWRPEGAQYVTAYLTVPNVAKSLDFYAAAFGFTTGEKMDRTDGEILHASVLYNGVHVAMLGSELASWCVSKSPLSSEQGSPVSFYLYHPDVEALFNQALAAGAKQIMAIEDQFWGDRMGSVRDPFGYEWSIATKTGEFDASMKPKLD